MTKTIIVILLSLYSLARLITGAYQIYTETLLLPYWVLGVSGVCCLCILAAGVALCFGKLRAGTLRRVILLNALGAAVNLVGLVLFPVNGLGTMDLVVTGTLFDILFYLGTLTIRLQDSARMPQAGLTPFNRLGGKNRGKRHAGPTPSAKAEARAQAAEEQETSEEIPQETAEAPEEETI